MAACWDRLSDCLALDLDSPLPSWALEGTFLNLSESWTQQGSQEFLPDKAVVRMKQYLGCHKHLPLAVTLIGQSPWVLTIAL